MASLSLFILLLLLFCLMYALSIDFWQFKWEAEVLVDAHETNDHLLEVVAAGITIKMFKDSY